MEGSIAYPTSIESLVCLETTVQLGTPQTQQDHIIEALEGSSPTQVAGVVHEQAAIGSD